MENQINVAIRNLLEDIDAQLTVGETVKVDAHAKNIALSGAGESSIAILEKLEGHFVSGDSLVKELQDEIKWQQNELDMMTHEIFELEERIALLEAELEQQ